jgi:hypothetical protein
MKIFKNSILFIFFLFSTINCFEHLEEGHGIIKLNQKTNEKLRILLECNPDITCSGNGNCTNSTNLDSNNITLLCDCEPGYTTLQNATDTLCGYKQKKQKTAFLLELLLGFGAGHFYAERYTFAGLKLAAFVYGVLIICLFPLTAKLVSEKCDSDLVVIAFSCFFYVCALGLAFWYIWDMVMFGLNKYEDGNGIPLMPWNVTSKD